MAVTHFAHPQRGHCMHVQTKVLLIRFLIFKEVRSEWEIFIRFECVQRWAQRL